MAEDVDVAQPAGTPGGLRIVNQTLTRIADYCRGRSRACSACG